MARGAKAPAAEMTPERLRQVLGSFRYTFANERDLQDGLAQALHTRGIRFDREVPLTPDDRPDFMVEGIAVEVKIGGGLSDVTRQLHRYAQHKGVRALLLVTARCQLGNLPRKMSGKPVDVLSVGGIW